MKHLRPFFLCLALCLTVRAQPPAAGVFKTPANSQLIGGLYGAEGLVDVRGYGAKGDGTTDDTAAIQAAITATPSFGVVFFPKGTYLMSSQIALPNSFVTLMGYGAKLTSTSNATYRRFSASGKVYITFLGLTFDGGNSAGATTGLVHGQIELNASDDILIKDCTFQNVCQEGVWISGASVRVNVTDCHFNNFFCGVFSNWDSTNYPMQINVSDCQFVGGLGTTTTALSGAIKLAGGGSQTVRTGDVIHGNIISLPGQMGIEANSCGGSGVIDHNTITGAGYAISHAGVNGWLAADNIITAADQFGLEFAAGCSACTASDNLLNGVNSSGTPSGGIGGSIADSTGITFQGGSIGGFGTGLYAQDSGGFVVGLKVDNITFFDAKAAGSSPLVDLKSVTNYSITHCHFNGVSANTGSFIFLDTTDGSVLNGLIDGNFFAGSTSSTGITFYYPGTSNLIAYLQVSNNNTTAVTSFAGQTTVGAGSDLQSQHIRFFGNIDSSTTASNFSNCLNVASVQASSTFTAANGWFKWERGFVQCNATSGAFTVTLPDARGIQGYEVTIQKIDSSGNAITLATTASQTLIGKNLTTWQSSTSGSLASQGSAWTVKSDGANWIIELAR